MWVPYPTMCWLWDRVLRFPSVEGAQGSRQGPDPFFPADTLELPEAMLSPMSIDSATSADTTLDTTGDVTVEDVKDFLG